MRGAGVPRERRAGPRLLLAAVGALALSACSGLDSWSDFDPSRIDGVREYRSWGWAPYGDGKAGDIRSNDRLIDDELLDARLRASIERHLSAKGYRPAEDGAPDFRVGYHVSVEGRMDVGDVNSYYGYGWGGYWGPSGPPRGVSYTPPDVHQYREGTLVVDVVDGGDDQLVWRGVVLGELLERRDARERDESIDRAVRVALKDFPPRG
jgi:hypothetical protein